VILRAQRRCRYCGSVRRGNEVTILRGWWATDPSTSRKSQGCAGIEGTVGVERWVEGGGAVGWVAVPAQSLESGL